MVLTTHAVIGAALTQHVGDYAAVFILSFASHYVADMIPHWHYPTNKLKKAVETKPGTKSISFNAHFFPEMVRVAFDLGLGVAISLMFFEVSPSIIILGAFAATIPDLMVGAGHIWPNAFLTWHDRLHRWIHSSTNLDDRPLLGIGSQVVLIILFIFLFGSR